MKKFKFKKLDAFASGRSGGNPAAAVYLNSFNDITGEEMQRIASELKGFVSEVGFIARSGDQRFRLRYFSSEKEVEFCGHATIAIMYDLLKTSPGEIGIGCRTIALETNKGVLDVEDRIADEDCVYITAPLPRYNDAVIDLQEICAALNVRAESIDRDMAVGIVNAGNETLCVPINSLDDLVKMAPDYMTLRAFCHAHGLDVVTVFSREVSDRRSSLRTRVFAAPFGYLEDPATGSGNAALGYHLIRHDLWDGGPITLEQNNDKRSPNIIRMKSRKDDRSSLRVLFGGGAITRIDGEYII